MRYCIVMYVVHIIGLVLCTVVICKFKIKNGGGAAVGCGLGVGGRRYSSAKGQEDWLQVI